jgi:LmbE family N-acetylglucosaminyl deacetylase
MNQRYSRPLLFFLFLFTSLCLQAQSRRAWTSGEIREAMEKLNVLGSVLYLAAHPDDENTRLIAYLARGEHYRTGYLSLTRGDGGQNLIGEEQGVELGLIRTQELLAARRMDGGEQFFSRAFDFGYSKSPEEALQTWGRNKILSDVVWIIRRFRPDVIITRFPVTGEGGHGHHTASAILANEAFAAAADPKMFPEQLDMVEPWQVKRVLWNTFNFGSVNTIREDQFKVDVGGYNPALGKSYGEIAAESRSQHKSQGFGVPSSRGESFEWFQTTKGDAPTTNLLDGVNSTWTRLPGGEAIIPMVQQLLKNYNASNPQSSVPALQELYNAVEKLQPHIWRTQKLKEIRELIIQCSGIYAEATVRQASAVPGDSLQIQLSVISRLAADWQIEKAAVAGYDSSLLRLLQVNRPSDWTVRVALPQTLAMTQPYWLEEPMEKGAFVVKDRNKIGQPDADPGLKAMFRLRLGEFSIEYQVPVLYKYTDPVKGEQYQPLAILPAMELNFVQDNYLQRRDSSVQVRVRFASNRRDSVDYDLQFIHSNQWSASREKFPFRGHMENEATSFFRPTKADIAGSFAETIGIQATDKRGRVYQHYRRDIQYDHIPHIIYFARARTNIIHTDLRTTQKKIGYIPGAGDKIPQALELMGYEVVMLGEKEISRNHLAQFDAIITGVRAYNTNAWMNRYYEELMDYVQQGGRMIVQYNTSSSIGPVRGRIAPYNFDISRTRVTLENAPVTLMNPADPIWNSPNKISSADFENWVQERSIYHATNWDKKNFEALIKMGDPGETPDDGSLIRAKYGKGQFIYTGWVFFRQLPAGVPGAYRILANLVESGER